MGLQNRVDPLGNLIRTPARGGWLGNRGLLHDPRQEIRRPYRLTAWLICRLEFKDRRRIVMSPGLYTELFFLDEATALSAGHRPCAECRRPAYVRFKALAEVAAGYALPRAGDMDDRLQADRMDADGTKRTFVAEASSLPDGVFIEHEGQPWLLWRGHFHRWSPAGYTQDVAPPGGRCTVITPRLTVEIIRAGYPPQVAL